MKNKKKVLHLVFLIIIDLIIVYTTYVSIYYPHTDFDQYLFAMRYGLSNSDFTPLYDGVVRTFPFVIILFLLLYFIFYKSKLKENIKRYSIILGILTIFVVCFNLNLFSYSYYKLSSSSFIEENYVNPENTAVKFNKKNNLIMIFLESFESTIADKENGGSFKYNLIPNISNLNKNDDVTYFKTQDNKYGMKMIDGATFTSASLITNTSGVPFKYYNLSPIKENNFLNGAYTLGDLLYDNGYHNELISSANTDFGEVNNFFSIHGKYDIIDINSYKDYDLTINDDDLLDWGFNDNYLFETAKKRLDILSKKNEPFNLTLVGIDTHFPKGYLTNYTVDKYENQYENVYATEDILVNNFINWLREQKYFKDTTIVIIGDHLSMEYTFFKDINKDNRYIYASYINSVSNNYSDNRVSTALDTYPSVLGAMGVSIDGNQLGLGVNLFSGKETLSEKYGFNKLNSEVKKKSNFYKNNIYTK